MKKEFTINFTVKELLINPETKSFDISFIVIIWLVITSITILFKKVKQINYSNRINKN